MRRTFLRTIISDSSLMHSKKFKRVELQIETVEKYFSSLKSKVKSYCSVKKSELKSLKKISTVMQQYAEVEENSSVKSNLTELSKILSELNKHLETFSSGLDDNVLKGLSDVKQQVKHLKNDLKCAVSAAGDETVHRRQVQRMQGQQARLAAAEAGLEKARRASGKASSALMDHSQTFERNKLATLRSTLILWTVLELQYHARALESFTDAYTAAAAIDVDADLEEFQCKVVTPGDELLNDRLGIIQETHGYP